MNPSRSTPDCLRAGSSTDPAAGSWNPERPDLFPFGPILVNTGFPHKEQVVFFTGFFTYILSVINTGLKDRGQPPGQYSSEIHGLDHFRFSLRASDPYSPTDHVLSPQMSRCGNTPKRFEYDTGVIRVFQHASEYSFPQSSFDPDGEALGDPCIEDCWHARLSTDSADVSHYVENPL